MWTDVDMTYPNTEIPALVKELEGCDQVVGARTSEQGTARILRVPTKWFIRRLAEYLVEEPIPDLNSGFRAFRKVIAAQFLHLLPNGFSCVSTLTMCFLTNGYSIRYVPIEYSHRCWESKFHWWKDTTAVPDTGDQDDPDVQPPTGFPPGGDDDDPRCVHEIGLRPHHEGPLRDDEYPAHDLCRRSRC